MTRRSTAMGGSFWPLAPVCCGRISSPIGATPRWAAPARSAASSTSWNVIFAVLPMTLFRCSGSDRPGIFALARDCRLTRAEIVDALAHHLDRLGDDLFAGLRLVAVGHLQREETLAI